MRLMARRLPHSIPQPLERVMRHAVEVGKRRKPSESTVYTLLVTLLEIEPPIWRRVQVPASITLRKLHKALQAAMGGRTRTCTSS